MKKSLAALAILGAFAGTAAGADVTVYGVIDTGLQFQNISYNGGDLDSFFFEDESSFKMSSGVNSGSRFGLKGTEDLGNGLSVSFVLENGFTSDDGALNNGGRLFGRESQVSFHSAIGTIAMGRMGNLVSGNGTYGLAGGLSPFGTSWGDYSAAPNNVMTTFDRYDNTVTYMSPDFSGFKLYAQYSFGTDAKNTYGGEEGKSSIDRYAAIGATYANGPLSLVAIVDQTNYSTTRFNAADPNSNDLDDALSVTFGGSYDFTVTKLYAGVQYFKDADISSVDRIENDYFAATDGDTFQMKGFGITLGADIPLAGGTFKIGTAYMDGTIEKVNKWDMTDGGLVGEIDLTRWNTSAGYQYNLSKRTSIYGVASYSYNNVEGSKAYSGYELDVDVDVFEAAVGLVHKF